MTLRTLPNWGLVPVDETADIQRQISELSTSLSALDSYRRKYSVLEFSSVQAAFDGIPSGACLYFPDGDYTATVAAGWTITKPVEIFGNQLWGTATGTTRGCRFHPFDNAGDPKESNCFDIQADDVWIHDCSITPTTAPSAASASAATGNGVYLNSTGAGTLRNTLTLERVRCTGLGGTGISINGSGGGGCNFLRILDCFCTLNKKMGLYVSGIAYPIVQEGYYSANAAHNAYFNGSENPRIWGVSFEGGQTAGSSASFDTQLRLSASHAFSVLACTFENYHAMAGACRTAVVVENCLGGLFAGIKFINASAVTVTRGIFLVSTTRGVDVRGCAVDNSDFVVQENDTDNCDGNTVGAIAVKTYDATNGRALVTMAKDSASTSAVSQGSASAVARVMTGALAASSGPNTILTGSKHSAGKYRFSPTISITVAQAIITVQGTLAWTSPAGAQTMVFPAAPMLFTGGLDQPDTLSIDISVAVSTNVTWTTTVVGAIVAGRYALNAGFEKVV